MSPVSSLRGLAAKAFAAVADKLTPARIPTRDGGSEEGGPWSRHGGQGWGAVFRSFLPGARFDWEAEAGDLWANSVVAISLQWIGDRVARPLLKVGKVGRSGQLVEIKRHGLVELWTRPNPKYGRRTLEKAVVLSLKVDGNAYIYKVRDNGGRVRELWWIPHFRCRPLWPSDGSVYTDGFRISVDGRLIDVPEGDVIHIRDGIDPRNERLGLAAVKACLREVCTVNGESTHTAALLKNSAVGAVAIVPDGANPGPPNPAQAAVMEEKFRDKLSGDDAGGVVAFQGPYKVVEIGYSPEKLALDKLPVQAIARVAAALGPTAMSLGLPDPNKTYSNLGEANRASWGTIVATQEMVAEAIRDDLATETILVNGRITPASGPLDLVVWYDYTGIQELQESLDALHARTREDYKAGLVTRNEAREKIGEDPDPDGDVYFVEPGGGGDPDPDAGEPDPDDQADDQAGDPDAGEDRAGGRKAWRPWRY